METNKISFPVVIYGDISQYNNVLSKARCRIFYKYGNRNGTYITDEFAEKLISTIAYVPVKGIYSDMAGDYRDHGQARNEGRIYGIVPENPNFAWEQHLDEDGKVRDYACVDVLLFTGIYEDEALKIVNKSQSMELYAKSIKGEWQFIDGQKYFVFEDGCFLGLQVLGDDVEPCFEGAAFFTLYESLTELVKKLEEYNLSSIDNDGGKEEMIIDFKLSDNQKFGMIFSLLNPNFNEENGWQMDYAICDVYDPYALAFNYESGSYERVYYEKSDETDSLAITNKETAYIVDINEAEKTALKNLRVMNGETYEKVDEKFSQLEELQNKNAEFSQKIEEQDSLIATLNQEIETVNSELETTKTSYTEASNKIAELDEELNGLKEYKVNVELNKKKEIIGSYSNQLSAETLKTFEDSIDSYSCEDLEKELAYTLVKSKPSLFDQNHEDGYIPKDEGYTGIEEILSRYKNN